MQKVTEYRKKGLGLRSSGRIAASALLIHSCAFVPKEIFIGQRLHPYLKEWEFRLNGPSLIQPVHSLKIY
jgi:hypothetical protein